MLQASRVVCILSSFHQEGPYRGSTHAEAWSAGEGQALILGLMVKATNRHEDGVSRL